MVSRVHVNLLAEKKFDKMFVVLFDRAKQKRLVLILFCYFFYKDLRELAKIKKIKNKS
jgi:hypothetical protein